MIRSFHSLSSLHCTAIGSSSVARPDWRPVIKDKHTGHASFLGDSLKSKVRNSAAVIGEQNPSLRGRPPQNLWISGVFEPYGLDA